MKAKLIKSEDSYILKDGLNHVLGIDDKKLKDRLECPYLLSKQNCDELFGVIDVEKLADEITKEYATLTPKAFKRGVVLGINKAMELNKDKVFTMEQMNRAIHLACSEYSGNIIDEVTQQPTEMNVDIIKECPQCQEWGYVSECRNDCNQKFLQPKLDSSGCIILTKKL